MGTQQILMIVLSVIVVGAAIAVGIQMFDSQSRNMTRAAIQTDFLQMGVNIQAYFRTPVIMGGAGNLVTNVSLANLMSFINAGDTSPNINTPDGTYIFTDPGSNVYVDITMDPVPSVSDWTALARIFYDGRTNLASSIEKGMWTYVGPTSNVQTRPNP